METQTPTTKAPFRLVIEELLVLINSFSNVLVAETDALKEINFKKVDSLQEEKKNLAKQYQTSIQDLSDRKDELTNLDINTREKLKQTRTHFNTILEANLNALDAARNSNQRLVDYILDIARQSIKEDHQVNYSNMGRTATYKSASTSMAIDEEL